MKKYFTFNQSDHKQISHKHNWNWYPCSLTLEQQINKSTVFWNTSPTIKLFLNSKKNMPEECNFTVEMDRMFKYDPKFTWFWHKSWILPEISVDIKCNNADKDGLGLKDVFIHLYITKVSNLDDSNMFITDIGIIGQSILKAELGKNTFTTLKFNSTSFNHSNSKFNILIMVIKTTPQNPMICDVISSFISPPIYVDSRKVVRNSVQEKNQSKIYSLFEPALLDKLYFKRKSGTSIPIKNKVQDLINYFTSPNIRNKVWNPIFLCYKFSQSLSLFYNTCSIQNYKQLIQELFQGFQKLKETESTCKSTHKIKFVFDKMYQKTLLCILVTETNQQIINQFKKIVWKFDIGENQLVSFLFSEQLVSPKFKKIQDFQNFRCQYQKYYKSLTGNAVGGEALHLESAQQEQLLKQQEAYLEVEEIFEAIQGEADKPPTEEPVFEQTPDRTSLGVHFPLLPSNHPLLNFFQVNRSILYNNGFGYPF